MRESTIESINVIIKYLNGLPADERKGALEIVNASISKTEESLLDRDLSREEASGEVGG